MIRTALLAALAASTFAGAAAAASGWTTTGLNFRDGPGTQYRSVAYLPHCAELTTYEWQGGWVRAEWQGQYGWVAARYVAENNAHCTNYGSTGHSTGYTRRTY